MEFLSRIVFDGGSKQKAKSYQYSSNPCCTYMDEVARQATQSVAL